MKYCLFCKIANGKIPCDKVYEDKHIIAFLDIKPATKGHCLVLPKKHYKEFLDVNPKEFNNLMSVCQKILKVLMRVVNAKGYNVIINGREIGGQIVDHIHIHLMPRFKNDRFVIHGSRVSNKGNKELTEQIKRFL